MGPYNNKTDCLFCGPVTDQYPPSQSLKLYPALEYLPMSLRSMPNFMLAGVDKNITLRPSVIQLYKLFGRMLLWLHCKSDLHPNSTTCISPDLLWTHYPRWFLLILCGGTDISKECCGCGYIRCVRRTTA